jgi:hypothetical protein
VRSRRATRIHETAHPGGTVGIVPDADSASLARLLERLEAAPTQNGTATTGSLSWLVAARCHGPRARDTFTGAFDVSLSLAPGRPPRLRGLIQTTAPRADRETVEAVRGGLETALTEVARHTGGTPATGDDYARSLLLDLFDRVYDPDRILDRQPLRFGLGIQRGAGTPPGLRLYLDLHAHGPDAAADLGADVLARVGLGTPGEPTLPPDWPRGAAAFGRVLGLDVGPRGPMRLKLYLPATRFSLRDLRLRVTGGRRAGPGDPADAGMVALESALGRGLDEILAAPSTLVGTSLGLTRDDPGESPKIDVHLPDFLPHDGACARAVERLCGDLGIDPEPYRRALPALLEDRPAETSANVHQYLSLDRLGGPDGSRHKLNVYFRPHAGGTGRLPRRSRPRPVGSGTGDGG